MDPRFRTAEEKARMQLRRAIVRYLSTVMQPSRFTFLKDYATIADGIISNINLLVGVTTMSLADKD